MRLRLLAAILVSLLPLLHAASLTAALFTVTTTADENDGTPDPGVEGTSLREAILAANANAEADEIRFDAALAGDELSVSLFDTGRSDGEFGPTAFSVFTEIEINGPAGDDGITIKRAGGDNFRLFHVTITGDLTLRNLTLQGGVAQGFDGGSGGGGGGGSAGVGGAVLNQGTLTLDGSTLTGNMALGGHGANSGNANDRGGGGGAGVGQHGADGASETFGVTAPGGAGGDPNGGAPAGSGGGGDGGSGITAAASVVGGPGADGGFFFGGGGGGGSARSASGNSQTGGAGGAGGYGGGDGSAGGAGTNSPNGDGGGGAGLGGAIFNHSGTVVIRNSTLSGNVARGGDCGNPAFISLGDAGGGSALGAAIFSRNGSLYLINATIARNELVAGRSLTSGADGDADGAVFGLGDGATFRLVANNSIVADTTGGDDVLVRIVNGGTSLIGGVNNLVESFIGLGPSQIATNDDPALADLADNRGPTPTHALLPGSPAIDAGNNDGASGLLTDQRGGIFDRFADGDLDGDARVDIGAFELTPIDYGDAPDFFPATGPASILLEPPKHDDFRISFMGDDAEMSPVVRTLYAGRDSHAAYNSVEDEFLVVWVGDTDAGNLSDNEFEIYAQRISGDGAKLLDDPIRVSVMGRDGDFDFQAADPAVVWNARDNLYLVVWWGDDDADPLVDNEFEIFGQFLTGKGELMGDRIRISFMGPKGSTAYRAQHPDVAYNPTDNEYLVVWSGEHDKSPLVDNEFEIFAQRISANGLLEDSMIRVSFMGDDAQSDHGQRAAFGAINPRIAWNSEMHQYLAVWSADDDTPPLVDNEAEIFGRILDRQANPTGNQQRLSFMGPDGNPDFRAGGPDVAAAGDEFFVVWYGDDNTGALVDNENEVYGRRVSAADAAPLGDQLRISQAGGTGQTFFSAIDPRVGFNPESKNYFVVWRANSLMVGKYDIFGRRVSIGGTVIDNDDLRVSAMGPADDPDFTAFSPALAANSKSGSYLVTWNGDDDIPPLIDGETEIFGQFLTETPYVDYNTRADDFGPAHRITPALVIGADIDSELNGQPSLQALGDDLEGESPNDEDGVDASLMIQASPAPTVAVPVVNALAGDATLNAWIDYNGDGVFSNATERVSTTVPAGGPTTVTLTLPPVPPIHASPTFARFRLSTDPAAADPTGFALDGEVEDHALEIVPLPLFPEIRVAGNGLEIADGQTTTSLENHTDFGDALVDSETVVRTFTIANLSTETALDLTGAFPVVLSGPGDAHFSVAAQPATDPIPPGEATTFQLTFDPATTGTLTATVTIGNDDPDEAPYSFAIRGEGLLVRPIYPEIAIHGGQDLEIADGTTTTSIQNGTDFGPVHHPLGMTDRSFVIHNISAEAELHLTTMPAVLITGPGADHFSIHKDPETNALPPLGTTYFIIRFDPSTTGVMDAIVEIPNNDPDENPYRFAIQGEGILATEFPDIAVFGNGLEIADGSTTTSAINGTDFGTVLTSADPVGHSFDVRNTGEAELVFEGELRPELSGPDADQFSLQYVLDIHSLQPGESSFFMVFFGPTSPGVKTATVTIASLVLDENPYTFVVRGVARHPAEIAILGNGVEIANGDDTPSLADHTDFGVLDFPSTAVARTFTLDNTAGLGDLDLLTTPPVQLSGPAADQFLVTLQPAPNPVPAGSSSPFIILYQPTRPGTHRATVIIDNNDPDESTTTFAVQGIRPLPAGNGVGAVINYLLGISSDAMGLDFNEDATVDIADAIDRVNAVPPAAPALPNPADAAGDVPTTASLAWQGDARALDYDLWLWPAAEARPSTPTATGLIDPAFTPSAPLAPATLYNWQVRANGYGAQTEGPVWGFTTQPAAKHAAGPPAHAPAWLKQRVNDDHFTLSAAPSPWERRRADFLKCCGRAWQRSTPPPPWIARARPIPTCFQMISLKRLRPHPA